MSVIRQATREAMEGCGGDFTAAGKALGRRVLTDPEFRLAVMQEVLPELSAAPAFDVALKEELSRRGGDLIRALHALFERFDARENPTSTRAVGVDILKAMVTAMTPIMVDEADRWRRERRRPSPDEP